MLIARKYKTAYGWLGVIGILALMMIAAHYKILKPLFKYHTSIGLINPSILLLITLFMYLIFRNYHASKLHIFLLTLHSYIITFVGYQILLLMLMVFVMTETDAPYYPEIFIAANIIVYAVSSYFLLKKIFKTNFDKFVVINHVALTGVLLFIFVELL